MVVERIPSADASFPVPEFFNGPSRERFVTALDRMADGWGMQEEYVGAFMPKNIGEDEQLRWEDIGCAEFYFGEEDGVRIPPSDFRSCLAMAVEAEVAARPGDAAALRVLHAAADGWLAAHPLVAAGRA